MPKTTTALSRTYIEGLCNRGFITEAQRDAYISKDQKALEKADAEAMREGLKKSKKDSTPTSSRRTSSTATNPANNHRSPSASSAISRNARSASQKGQEKRATAIPSDRALLTFDSIRTTMEKKGFVRIQPSEVSKNNNPSAILTFLQALNRPTPGNLSKEWDKYAKALGNASRSKKDNDKDELPDLQGLFEYHQVKTILDDLTTNPLRLGDVTITLYRIKKDGTRSTETIGKGTKEMHLVIRPDKRFEAFFKE